MGSLIKEELRGPRINLVIKFGNASTIPEETLRNPGIGGSPQ